jgi:hypothetical protein
LVPMGTDVAAFCISCMKPITERYFELRWLVADHEMARGPYHAAEEIRPVPGLVYEIVERSFAEDRWEDEGGA